MPSAPNISADGHSIVRHIPLSRGLFATVDAADYEWLTQWKWHATSTGYAARNHRKQEEGKRSLIYMHSVIANTPEGMNTDHRNGDGFNNRRINLRTASVSANGANRGKTVRNRWGFKGVRIAPDKARWSARLRHAGKDRHLGYFDDAVSAAKAYDAEAEKVFGEFARLNFPRAA